MTESRPQPLLRRLEAPIVALFHEAAKFGTVGAINVVVDVAIFNILRFHVLPDKPITDKIISTSIAIVSSYFMNRHWTWRDRTRTGIRRELPLFFFLSAIGLLISVGCLAVSHYVLDFTSPLADNISANVIGIGLGMIWRFWAFRRWVFLPQDPDAEEEAAEAVLRTTV